MEELLNKQGRILLSVDDADKIQAAWEINQLSDLERSDVSRAKGIDERAVRALLGMATPISESLRTDARLYRTPRELDASERDCDVQQTSFKPRAAADKARQDVRVGSALEMLVPMLSGAEEVFVEPYRFAAGTASGADTSFYMRAAAHAAAYQAGAGRTSEVNSSSWRKSFPRKGESLLECFSIPPPTCKDSTDAVCILLHQLVRQSGFSLAAGEYEAM